MTGHGHVTPLPTGAKARCGGPALCPECARELMESGKPVRTGLRLALNCEDWPVMADVKPDQIDPDLLTYSRTVTHRSGQRVPAATLRRIGWLDQLGRVWLKVPPSAEFDGGSLTPLLIDPGERNGC